MKLKPHILFRKIADGTGILFDAVAGKPFSLNCTTAAICEALQQEVSREDILNSLARQTDLPPQAGTDLDRFLDDLKRRGWLED